MSQEQSPLDLFRTFLTLKEWPWTEPNASTIHGMITGEIGHWRWGLRQRDDGEFITLYSTAPLNVPVRRRNAAMEYLTRVNWGMTIAAFEIDLNDGQVNCRTCLSTRGLTIEAIEQFVLGNFAVMDHYLPGLMAVIYGKESPQKAIANAEGKPSVPEVPHSDDVSQSAKSDRGHNPKHPPNRTGRLFSGDN